MDDHIRAKIQSHPSLQVLLDIQSRLYREIGLQAVAAELNVPLDTDVRTTILESARELKAQMTATGIAAA